MSRAHFVVVRVWEAGLLDVVARRVCSSVIRDSAVVLCWFESSGEVMLGQRLR